MSKIGIFGSAFNPPTNAHKMLVDESLKYFDKVILLPSYSHPNKNNLVEYNLRVEMLNALFDDNRVEISTIEKEIYSKKNDTVYTIDLIEYLDRYHSNLNYYLIFGSDNKDLIGFNRRNYIINNTRLYFLDEVKGIRSSKIRKNLKSKKSISGLTSDSVINIIKKYKLYGDLNENK